MNLTSVPLQKEGVLEGRLYLAIYEESRKKRKKFSHSGLSFFS
jgi:hypothetical protein